MNTVKLSDLKPGSYVNYSGEIFTKEQAEQIIAAGNRPTLYTVSDETIQASLLAASQELKEDGKVSDSYSATDTSAMRIVYDQEDGQQKNELLLQLVREQEKVIQKLSTEIGYVSTECALLQDCINEGDEQLFQLAEELLALDDLVFWVSGKHPVTSEQTWMPAVGKKVKILEKDYGAHFHPVCGWRITELETGSAVACGETLNEALIMSELRIEQTGDEKIQELIKAHLAKLPPKPEGEPKVDYSLNF